uniref:Putative reverse transcriptase domain-containing protein n=1 Tax=Tanacetum cinerariifolium TaxID=118510 RepID=A0A699IJ22_TANCI|nr:putative reverse transcriptase domain-containing protein [Tanacetum cinerariifolium]
MYVGPFKLLKKVGSVAYKLELPQELSRVHNMFLVSNLKKCYFDEPLPVPLDGLHIDDKLYFREELIEIMDREVKQLKQSRIAIIKVRRNSKRGPEFTWEREDQFRKKYPHLFTKTALSSSFALGLVPKPTSAALFVPLSRNDLDLLFQPLFDELLAPPPSVDSPAPEFIAPINEVVAQELYDSTGLPSLTTVDQDAPSPKNDPLFGMLIPKVTSDQSSSTLSSHIIVNPDHQIPQHNSKWTKDHPLDNIIGQLSRPVSTRLQPHEQALFCYYDAFLTSVEPKMYKDALTQSCWIKAMQEELNEFERLKVWGLVPRPDKVMVITLKWIYKVKLDELGGILKNKARLVARGYRQEEGIDFEESFASVA